MRDNSKKLFATVCVLSVLGIALSAPEAQARPQYLKQFITQYPALANTAKMKKCGLCHPQNKKMRLDYGEAVGNGLGKDKDGNPVKNEKNEMNIKKALEKAEEVKSKTTGKTFGEMIKAGDIPE